MAHLGRPETKVVYVFGSCVGNHRAASTDRLVVLRQGATTAKPKVISATLQHSRQHSRLILWLGAVATHILSG